MRQVKALDKKGENIMTKLYKVVGMYELEDCTFASCTTYDKAKKALKIVEQNGFEDMVEIVQDAIPVDAVVIDEKIIEL